MTELCPACRGQGVQLGSDGLQHRCPACDGAGKWRKPETPASVPTPYPWSKPWPPYQWGSGIPPYCPWELSPDGNIYVTDPNGFAVTFTNAHASPPSVPPNHVVIPTVFGTRPLASSPDPYIPVQGDVSPEGYGRAIAPFGWKGPPPLGERLVRNIATDFAADVKAAPSLLD